MSEVMHCKQLRRREQAREDVVARPLTVTRQTMSGFSKLTQAFKDLPGDLSHIKKKVEKLPSTLSKAKEALECERSPHLLETKN